MEIDRCTKEDFDQILTEIALFWGSDRTLALHHPLFLYEWGETAFVIRDGGRVAAYLLPALSRNRQRASGWRTRTCWRCGTPTGGKASPAGSTRTLSASPSSAAARG